MPLSLLMTHDKKKQLSPSSSDVPVYIFIIVVERMKKKAFHMIPVSISISVKNKIKQNKKGKDLFLVCCPIALCVVKNSMNENNCFIITLTCYIWRKHSCTVHPADFASVKSHHLLSFCPLNSFLLPAATLSVLHPATTLKLSFLQASPWVTFPHCC